MAIVIIYPIILWVCSSFFKSVGWSVKNYLGVEVPYSLGLGVFIAILYFSFLLNAVFFLYLSVLYVTGFIDDRFGTKYPKGLKGHVSLFFRTGRVTTGFLKLVSTLAVSFSVIFLVEGGIMEKLTMFLLLVLPPHVMNLFDTRPLRVWKVMSIHLLFFLPLFYQMTLSTILSLLFIALCLMYFEGTRKGMLGDNGATLLGGVLSVVAIVHLSITWQWLLISFYLLIILITERFSISEWIEKTPLLRKIDRWGVS
ncbi:hypothetical protein DS745_15060 [Anaerobacillus alkaliphilus]|uniref:Uncharacterized protein n=1 Tax=Anaerobacillus alkaliphilus TaxID=1548597 RepID=A0A4Q0VRJ9_9BACI|nr:hypothetical protein [Anaerobacillus alkaliphilus]RXI99532.1 hypothetical protein DS745_15060 [Anaerobacillus alkaliphilus]